jgi:hydrogenase maturation protease
MSRTIVIGLGNPIVTDDAVGIQVARRVRTELGQGSPVAIEELYCGGLQLMEALVGYDRAILVDAIVTGGKPGTIHHLSAENLGLSRNSTSTHDGSLLVALEFGALSGAQLPFSLNVWAVEAADVTTFSEFLSPDVQRAVPQVAAEILGQLALAQVPLPGE